MRRLVVFIVAILATWLGTTTPAMAAVAAPSNLEGVHVDAYDGHHTAVATYTTTNAPPQTSNRGTTYDAVDRWLHGAAARPGKPTSRVATTYDASTTLAQVARVSGTTEGQAQAVCADASSLESGGVAANTGDDVVRALSATERRTLDDALRPDKLDHIFDPKHNFEPLVQQFGSREAAMEQIVRSIGGPLPQAGRFEIAQSIGGQAVIIRGAVVDGVPRIGTAFTP